MNQKLIETQVERLAHAQYAAYCEHVEWKAFNGDPLPKAEEFFADESKQKQADGYRTQARRSLEMLAGGVVGTFGWAIAQMKAGCYVARPGWDVKGMWLCLIPAGNAMHKGYDMQDCIGMKTAGNVMQPGWLASQDDILAADWGVVGETCDRLL